MDIKMSTLVQFRAGQVASALQNRSGSPGVVAKRDLERYYHVLSRSIMDAHLDFPETLLTLEILRDVPLTIPTIRYAGAIVDDQLNEASVSFSRSNHLFHVAERLENLKYEAARAAREHGAPDLVDDFVLNRPAFIAKLKALSTAQIVALWDAAEQFPHWLDFAFEIRSEGGSGIVDALEFPEFWRPTSSATAPFLRDCDALERLNVHYESHLELKSAAEKKEPAKE